MPTVTAPTEKPEPAAGPALRDQWLELGATGTWGTNDKGEIVQTSAAGTAKPGSGALLVRKQPAAFAVQELRLLCRPGSQQQTGLVFRLVDEKTFCAFCIDLPAKRGLGYDLVVFAVENGEHRTAFRQSCTAAQPAEAAFVIRQQGTDLLLSFNGALTYTWPVTILAGRMGLYSQKNDDAVFLSLNAVPAAPPAEATGSVAPQPEPKPEGPPPVPAQPPAAPQPQPQIRPVPVESGDGLTGFLGIRKPAARTEVELTEVFTVPLDSFYASLYQSSALDPPAQPGGAKPPEVELLDLRIKRWYRELRDAREQLATALTDQKRKARRAESVEKQLDEAMGSSDDAYAALEKALAQRRAELRAAAGRVNRLRDAEGGVLREIRTNGYSVVENTVVDSVRALGYDFHIVGESILRGEYDPVELDPQADLTGDGDRAVSWLEAEKKLSAQLFGSGAITEKGAALYEQEKRQLAGFAANEALTKEKTALAREIERYAELQPLYARIAAEIEAEIADWQADREALLSRKSNYLEFLKGTGFWWGFLGIPPPAYGPGDWDKGYEWANAGVGWLETSGTPVGGSTLYPVHPRFQQEGLDPVAGIGRRVRLNRFVADVYFSATRPIAVRDGTIHTGLALHCPTESGLLSYYHQNLARYSRTTQLHYGWSWGWNAEAPFLGQSEFLELVERNTFNSSQDLHVFFDVAVQVCDYFTGKAQARLTAAHGKVRELETKKAVEVAKLADLTQHGLARERRRFLEKWNNPFTNLTAPIETEVRYPDEDPLSKFLADIAGHGDAASAPVETYFFAPTPDGFYNQNGLSLRDFMKARAAGDLGRDAICVFPVFDPEGRISGEIVKAVRNPVASVKPPALPTIKFVESYRMEVGWLGYGLGELSHSFNLFPGESKELVVEKSTKLKTRLEETRKTSEETAKKLTSSFEENLQNELSTGEKTSQEASSLAKSDSSRSGSSEATSTSDDTTTESAEIKAKASGGIGIVSGSIEGGYKYGATRKTGTSGKKNSAWAASQSAEEKRASHQSKEILAKNVANVVHKVAAETSQNNKVEFSAVSSREYEESATNREVIKLQNPNVGKTVNYNFFQVQNHYGVVVKLADVQVVLDSGVELVHGSGVNDVRVYDLEEFGKIYANTDRTDRDAALAAIIARQVMKHYGAFLPGVTSGNGAVSVPEGYLTDRDMVEALNFSGNEPGMELAQRIEKVKTALEYLKGVPFRFREMPLAAEVSVAVNAAAYHVEAQLGFLPATESYLETRRDIETEKQRALVEHLKAQTEARVFFPPPPDRKELVSLPQNGNE